MRGSTLPPSWTRARIQEILQRLESGQHIEQGWSPQCANHPVSSDGGWGVLKTTAIQAGSFHPEHNKELPAGLPPRPSLEVRVGDLLLTCAGPRARCGVPCMVRHTPRQLMISGKMYRFRTRADLAEPGFVEALLMSGVAQRAIDKMKTGISDSGLNLTQGRFRSLEVPLAPLPEQRRLVAKIEELFSELDAGVAALERAQAKLERYRASVLKAAVEGKLTEQWRKENPPEETGEELLKRILAERRKRWEEVQLADLEAKGKNPPKGWRETYKEPEGPDTSGLPELPEGWCWGTAEQLTDPVRTISYGIVKLGDHDPVGIPTLRSSNVRSLRLDLSFVKRVKRSVSNAYSRTIVRDGDVLVTIRGTLGGVARVPEALGGFNISREVALLAVLDQGLSDLLPYFIASPSSQGWVSGNLRGIAYTGINLSDLRFLPIPVPPRSEQVEIVRVLEDILGRAEQAGEALPTLKSRATLLRQSILKLAFEGRLVTQDPNDEPASLLLERIRASCKAEKPAANRRPRKRKSRQGSLDL